MVILNNIDSLDEKVIRRIVKAHKINDLPRLNKLNNYYNAKNEILNRLMSDSTKPNNKIANPYASYITDTLVGYFIGEPITYNSDNSTLLEELKMIFEYNDEADENAELAKNASIYGVAYELLYVADEVVRFHSLDPRQCIPIYDGTIENNLIAFIRYYDDYNIVEDKNYTMIEVITDTEITQ